MMGAEHSALSSLSPTSEWTTPKSKGNISHRVGVDYYCDLLTCWLWHVQEMTSEALRRVVVEYIKAVMQKRITFKSADERREGAERMIKEADQFKFLFRKLAAVSSHALLSLYILLYYTILHYTTLHFFCVDGMPLEGILNIYLVGGTQLTGWLVLVGWRHRPALWCHRCHRWSLQADWPHTSVPRGHHSGV